MIQITPQMRIVVAVDPVDLRNGIDGLARVCKQALRSDPFSGWLFVFRNRRGTAIKILVYDSQGFWLMHKRLSTGRFRFWPHSTTGAPKRLEAHELQVLLAAGNPAGAHAAPPGKSRRLRRKEKIRPPPRSTYVPLSILLRCRAWQGRFDTEVARSPTVTSNSSGN